MYILQVLSTCVFGRGGIIAENNTAFPFPWVLTDDIPYTICSVVAGQMVFSPVYSVQGEMMLLVVGADKAWVLAPVV